MSAESQQFAHRVLAAFNDAGRNTDEQIKHAGGPSSTTLTAYRRAANGEGDIPTPRQPTFERIEKAANWPAGQARKVWQGEAPPTALEAVGGVIEEVSLDERIEQLEARVSALEQGVHRGNTATTSDAGATSARDEVVTPDQVREETVSVQQPRSGTVRHRQ